MSKYVIAEKFKSVQGEGVYAGTPMAFIRFTGCSVGKKICQYCDTDFDTTLPWRGGGEFSAEELADWTSPYQHVCFTGGEPLDQDLEELIEALFQRVHDVAPQYLPTTIHIETSGTKPLREFFDAVARYMPKGPERDYEAAWVCISPKPGWLEENLINADEIKVIVPGLGTITPQLQHGRVVPSSFSGREPVEEPGHPLATRNTFRWPDLSDAVRWAEMHDKPVFLQPRNAKYEVDKTNLVYVLDLLRDYPQLRLSAQLHKILHVQ